MQHNSAACFISRVHGKNSAFKRESKLLLWRHHFNGTKHQAVYILLMLFIVASLLAIHVHLGRNTIPYCARNSKLKLPVIIFRKYTHDQKYAHPLFEHPHKLSCIPISIVLTVCHLGVSELRLHKAVFSDV